MAFGGLLGSRIRPGRRFRAVVSHLVGGLVLGIAAADLMPAASNSGQLVALAIWLCLGFSLLIVINAVLEEPPRQPRTRSASTEADAALSRGQPD